MYFFRFAKHKPVILRRLRVAIIMINLSLDICKPYRLMGIVRQTAPLIISLYCVNDMLGLDHIHASREMVHHVDAQVVGAVFLVTIT